MTITFHQSPETFAVSESLLYEPEGRGPFVFARLRARGLATNPLKRRVSEAAGVPLAHLRHAGLKDAAAEAMQWLSWPAASQRQDLVDGPFFQVVELTRHTNPLAIGHVRANRFRLHLAVTEDEAAPGWSRLTDAFPNFYGLQRFGGRPPADDTFTEWFERAGRDKFAVSAAQSWLFNRFLQMRLTEHREAILPDDIWILRGGKRWFGAEADETIQTRYRAGEISPSGPMFGYKLRPLPREREFLARWSLETEDFRRFGKVARGTRRALFVKPEWHALHREAGGVRLEFSLPAGCYATVFLLNVFHNEVLTRPMAEWPSFTRPVTWQGGPPDDGLEVV